MTAVAFDTLKFARSLKEKAHLTTEQAEGFAEAITDALHDDLATKTDLKTELEKAELRLEAKIETAKADIIKWLFGTIGFQTLVILGAVLALARFAHP